MHHVAVRHGNMTLVLDVLLVSFFVLFGCRILCDSMTVYSGSFCEREGLSLFIFILGHSLAQGRSQLDSFGSAGVVTLQGIAEAHLISNFLLALLTISS